MNKAVVYEISLLISQHIPRAIAICEQSAYPRSILYIKSVYATSLGSNCLLWSEAGTKQLDLVRATTFSKASPVFLPLKVFANELFDISVSGSRRVPKNRTSFKPRSTSYSHINLQAAPESSDTDGGGDDSGEKFFRKDSIQLQIKQQLLYQSKIAPASSPTTPTKPLTFAEAAMSTRHLNTMKDENGEATLFGPMSLESLGTFKYIKKKKRPSKWAPLDLAAETDGASEVENNSEIGQISRAVSPTSSPAKSTNGPQSSQQPQQQCVDFIIDDNSVLVKTPQRQEQGRFEGTFEVDQDPTPRALQGPFPSTTTIDTDPTPRAIQGPFPPNTRADHVHGTGHPQPPSRDESDTSSLRDRTELAMSGLTGVLVRDEDIEDLKHVKDDGDGFDSVEWDPDLDSALDQSPEPVAVHPIKPVTYTTVGSRVDPNIVPQFTAPNRIQREGASRRSQMPFMNRGHHDYYSSRDQPPPLNMQNSMHYTQQLARPPIDYGNRMPGTPPFLGGFQATDQENQWLPGRRDEGAEQKKQWLAEHEREGKQEHHIREQRAHTNESTVRGLGIQEQDVGNSVFNTPISSQGLQNMQTLQRLARFENPNQNAARIRLSEFSATKSQSTGPPLNTPTLALDALLRNKIPNGAKNNIENHNAFIDTGNWIVDTNFLPRGRMNG